MMVQQAYKDNKFAELKEKFPQLSEKTEAAGEANQKITAAMINKCYKGLDYSRAKEVNLQFT